MADILKTSKDGKILLGMANKSVREVVIPNGVEVIGHDAFDGCLKLENIYYKLNISSRVLLALFVYQANKKEVK